MSDSRQAILKLYKTILRLHRGLPVELKILGDEYVKAEFRRHKNLSERDTIVGNFVQEWLKYAVHLSAQLGLQGIISDGKVGSQLTTEQVDSFRADQLEQLYRLLQESSRTYFITEKK